jgi:hypothetical protein
MLGAWKEDRAFLLARYDRDGDGDIDLDEWQAARADAERTVEAKLAEEGHLVNPVRHRLGASHGWRPYLLGTVPEARLARRFRRWAVAHLAVFLLAGMAAVLLAQYAPPGPERPSRELFVSLPSDVTLRIAGRAFRPQMLPVEGGVSGLGFVRVTVPVGRLWLETVDAAGTVRRHEIDVPTADRLLLVTLPADGSAPAVVR